MGEMAMFSSFRIPGATMPTNAEPPRTPTSQDHMDIRGYTRVACNLCRARKLKCSGDKSSCTRCKTTGNPCIYPEKVRGSGSSKKRSHPSSVNSSTDEAELSPTTRTSSVGEEHLGSVGENILSQPGHERQAQHQNEVENLQGGASSLQRILDSSDATNGIFRPSSSDLRWEDATADLDLTDPALFILDDGTLNFDTFAVASNSSDSIQSSTTQLALTHDSQNEGRDFIDLMRDFETVSQAGPFPSPTAFQHPISSATIEGCRCMLSMVRVLEHIGLRRASPEVTGIDGFLECLHKGTRACNDVLMCIQCCLFLESSMLLAIVVQQLGNICFDVVSLLSTQERPSADQLPKDGTLEGAIWFGRYNIEMPKMRDTLLRNLIVLDLGDLQSLLAQLKNKIGRKRGAWTLLVEAEEKASKAHGMVQEIPFSL